MCPTYLLLPPRTSYHANFKKYFRYPFLDPSFLLLFFFLPMDLIFMFMHVNSISMESLKIFESLKILQQENPKDLLSLSLLIWYFIHLKLRFVIYFRYFVVLCNFNFSGSWNNLSVSFLFFLFLVKGWCNCRSSSWWQWFQRKKIKSSSIESN